MKTAGHLGQRSTSVREEEEEGVGAEKDESGEVVVELNWVGVEYPPMKVGEVKADSGELMSVWLSIEDGVGMLSGNVRMVSGME